MNLDSLIPTTGEWLRGTGPEADIVVSTRIRLARNLAAFPFTNRASAHQKAEIEALLRERIAKLDLPSPLQYLNDAWQDIDRVDDLLEQKISYAFSEDFGYLTACPTNVGTGMRASVMLHLPALGLTKQIEKVFRALQKINLVVRGLYGEGSRASGDFYQISNQVTLGKSEATALGEIREVNLQIIAYERQARAALLRENRQGLHDRVARAYGTLQSATMMTSEETMELLSSVRLGTNLGLLEEVPITTVNELFLHTQPAHLQKLMGSSLDGEERNAARAKYLRTRLREHGGSNAN